jgi:UDP-glucuronate 4-epimerase
VARVLLTGAAGFVGFHTARALCARGDEVIGFDNCNSYYDPALKQARLDQLAELPNFRFHRGGLEDAEALGAAMADARPETVIHLAAQAGVRYSLSNPQAYVDSNLIGFQNLLELCRHAEGLEHLVFASSSSVYGANTQLPFSTADRTDYPVSLYAATKKANEVSAHAYSHLYGIPTTGLRFFTVYGPWGRPDMAYFSFTKALFEGTPIKVFNHGRLERDFTYIDDIVEGVLRVADRPPPTTVGEDGGYHSQARYRLYNIGNHSPVALGDFIATLERLCDREATKEYVAMQPGDVHATYADVADLSAEVGFAPDTPLEIGLARFVEWYRDYYGIR